MKIVSRLSNTTLPKSTTLISFVSILAVLGPVITVSGGFWDAISHLLKEPELFWTIQHITVYFGVTLISISSILGITLLLKKSVRGSLKTGIKLVITGALIQIISGFADSLSHDVYGIDGLISWSHQPLELGLVLASLGGLFSIISFIFFSTWLAFNLVLILGHTIQCIPVYEIFSSGCAIL